MWNFDTNMWNFNVPLTEDFQASIGQTSKFQLATLAGGSRPTVDGFGGGRRKTFGDQFELGPLKGSSFGNPFPTIAEAVVLST
jgi:hypothetical protein